MDSIYDDYSDNENHNDPPEPFYPKNKKLKKESYSMKDDNGHFYDYNRKVYQHSFFYDIMFNGLICRCGKLGINGKIHCDNDEGACSCGATHSIGDYINEGIIVKNKEEKEKRGNKK